MALNLTRIVNKVLKCDSVLEGVSHTVQGPTDVCDRKMGKVTGEEDKRRIEISAALTLPSTVKHVDDLAQFMRLFLRPRDVDFC